MSILFAYVGTLSLHRKPKISENCQWKPPCQWAPTFRYDLVGISENYFVVRSRLWACALILMWDMWHVTATIGGTVVGGRFGDKFFSALLLESKQFNSHPCCRGSYTLTDRPSCYRHVHSFPHSCTNEMSTMSCDGRIWLFGFWRDWWVCMQK